ncbi:hypothetical protein [Acidilobus sp.]|uniref:hypothetical protein n=1 Tax=Acidilobus sp. TaxID=1872109 RepID=UPI003D000687
MKGRKEVLILVEGSMDLLFVSGIIKDVVGQNLANNNNRDDRATYGIHCYYKELKSHDVTLYLCSVGGKDNLENVFAEKICEAEDRTDRIYLLMDSDAKDKVTSVVNKIRAGGLPPCNKSVAERIAIYYVGRNNLDHLIYDVVKDVVADKLDPRLRDIVEEEANNKDGKKKVYLVQYIARKVREEGSSDFWFDLGSFAKYLAENYRGQFLDRDEGLHRFVDDLKTTLDKLRRNSGDISITS